MSEDSIEVEQYLYPKEISLLARLGVSFSMSGLGFSRQLEEPGLRTVWRAILTIQRRGPDSEHRSNWLVGDWIKVTDDWLGQGTALRIIGEMERECEFERHISGLAGMTIQILQMTELAIGVCCQLLDPQQLKLTSSELLSPEHIIRKRTLGKLRRLLIPHQLFVGEFDKRMDQFVANRNRFIHRLWIESRSESANHVTRMATFHSQNAFILALLKEADEIRVIFKGFYSAVGIGFAQRGDIVAAEQFPDDWIEDLEAFNTVRRPPSPMSDEDAERE